jgi:hypothetical protein
MAACSGGSPHRRNSMANLKDGSDLYGFQMSHIESSEPPREMEPCPFCGNEKLTVDCLSKYNVRTTKSIPVELKVKCDGCGAEVTFSPTVSTYMADGVFYDAAPEYNPFEHWNARAGKKEEPK